MFGKLAITQNKLFQRGEGRGIRAYLLISEYLSNLPKYIALNMAMNKKLLAKKYFEIIILNKQKYKSA